MKETAPKSRQMLAEPAEASEQILQTLEAFTTFSRARLFLGPDAEGAMLRLVVAVIRGHRVTGRRVTTSPVRVGHMPRALLLVEDLLARQVLQNLVRACVEEKTVSLGLGVRVVAAKT
ncbi:hypothetical protein DVJ83_17415 (plasmid) [Deinococcus wulumuqiensis]|uniref:Uncharacterized protein n=1 Tax=Deinococcus wulumuqiensis TaxID=980427 RepID=A0A345IMH1_9DEIO|nr:hypothetical protein DVJ83_17415 [Deinococcus wulumuqiensis]